MANNTTIKQVQYLLLSALLLTLPACQTETQNDDQITNMQRQTSPNGEFDKTVTKLPTNIALTKSERLTLAKHYQKKLAVSDKIKRINTAVAVTTTRAQPYVTAPTPEKHTQFNGIVTASKTVIVSPPINGVITDIFFEQGKWIKKGEPLYKISTKNLQARSKKHTALLRQAKTQLTSAQAAHKQAKHLLTTNKKILAQAKSVLERYEPLIADQAISAQVYEQAVRDVQINTSQVTATKARIKQTQADIKTAQANIQSQQNKLANDTEQLKQAIVRAPITAMVTEHDIKIGQKVSTESNETTGSVLLADMNPVFVEITPTSEQYIRLKKHLSGAKKQAAHKTNKVTLVLADKQSYAQSGRVSFDKMRVDNKSNKPIVRVEFNNDAGILLPNMQVTTHVNIPSPKTAKKEAEKPVVLLPSSAVMSVKGNKQTSKKSHKASDEKHFVFVVIDKNIAEFDALPTKQKVRKIEIREVRISGKYKGQHMVEFGLDANELVITDSAQELTAHSLVTLVKKLPR